MADGPDISKLTNLSPRTLVMVVGGGIAAGLLWRRVSGRSGGAMPGSLSYPNDVNGLAMDTVGNIGGNSRRDLVNVNPNLPNVSWFLTDTDGNRWLTDGVNSTPMGNVGDHDVPVSYITDAGLLGPKVEYHHPTGIYYGTFDPAKQMYKFDPLPGQTNKYPGGSKDGYISPTNSWLRRAA